MRSNTFLLALVFWLLVLTSKADFPQLHRALPSANGKPGYRVLSPGTPRETTSEFDIQDKYDTATDKLNKPHYRHRTMDVAADRSTTVFYSLVSAALVGLSGIFPLLVIPLDAGPSLKYGAGSALLKVLLSFAVGSLLGDVFLHLLPETWATVNTAKDPQWEHIKIGLWVVFGLLSFMIIEKIFMESEDDDEEIEQEEGEADQTSVKDKVESKNGYSNGYHLRSRVVNNKPSDNISHLKVGEDVPRLPEPHHHVHHIRRTESEELRHEERVKEATEHNIKISGYLNLLANCIDNFTHGLAVAGSYMISPKVGFCTTIAILLHEIPHEVGDFAILLRSGFDRWKAAKAQLCTASGGLLGALFALYSESAEKAGDRTSAILPFTAGGFLYIALVTVVPDLLKETSIKESFKQVMSILAGVLSMLMVTVMFE